MLVFYETHKNDKRCYDGNSKIPKEAKNLKIGVGKNHIHTGVYLVSE